MSDLAFINFPLEDIIKCNLCREQEKGVFRAVSRKENYARHLRKKHEITIENIKVRCSVCGRISDKPRYSAWRDTRMHYANQHSKLLEANVDKTVVPDQPLPDKSSTDNIASRYYPDLQASRQAEKIVAVNNRQTKQIVNVTDVIDLTVKNRGVSRMNVVKSGTSTSLPPAPTIQWNNPTVVKDLAEVSCVPDMPAIENLIVKKQQEASCHSTSNIVAAMGHMFNVFATVAADSQAPTTSSPAEKQPTDNNCTTPTAATQLSRIEPRARPALQRSWKRRLTSLTPVSPSKKLHSVVKD